MRSLLLPACLAAAFTLSACGGGGGGGGGGGTPALTVTQIQALTGLGPPVETVTAQRSRSPNIASRADSLILSTMYGETSDPDFPTFTLRARCGGTRCTLTEPGSGYSDTIYLSDFEIVHGPTQVLGSRYGITAMSLKTRDMDGDFTSFGAWMNHSAFSVQTESFVLEGTTIGVRYGLAGGDLTGSPPQGSATWLGIMTGTPVTGSGKGDRLVGTAALNLDLRHGLLLDVGFSGIKNIDRGAAHTTETVIFADIPIGGRGTFEAGLSGNRIQGGFYGPGHAEAAGVFEQSNIVGAFGAKRQ